MPIDSQYRWTSGSPTRSTTVPVHVLSLTMIIITRASRNVIQNPGVRCWNVPESLSWYLASMVTFRSSASLPACTALSAAIMIEILRVLADGTGTVPKRSAVAPVARSFRNQLVWNGRASHRSFRRSTRSRIGRLLRSTCPVEPWVRMSQAAHTIPDATSVGSSEGVRHLPNLPPKQVAPAKPALGTERQSLTADLEATPELLRSARQQRDEEPHGELCLVEKLVVAVSGDRVSDDRERVVRQPVCLCHRAGAHLEPVSDDGHRRDAEPLGGDGVVQTARRAASSVTNRGKDGVGTAQLAE